MSPNTIYTVFLFQIWKEGRGLLSESLTAAGFPTQMITRSGKAFETSSSSRKSGTPSQRQISSNGVRPFRRKTGRKKRMDTTGGPHASIYARLQVNPTAKVTGPGASAIKYDILTALLTTAAQEDGLRSRLALRLSLIITARFNWRSGVFNIGLTELARLWGVTERTVKRDMAQLRSIGWIRLDRAAARGRVAQYGIDLNKVLKDTMVHWPAVGPDFVARMTGASTPVQEPDNVVPLHHAAASTPVEDGTIWPQVAALLRVQDETIYAAWFADLTVMESTAECLTLAAPSPFVARYVSTHFRARLTLAATTIDRAVRDVRITCDL